MRIQHGVERLPWIALVPLNAELAGVKLRELHAWRFGSSTSVAPARLRTGIGEGSADFSRIGDMLHTVHCPEGGGGGMRVSCTGVPSAAKPAHVQLVQSIHIVAGG